MTAIEMAPIKEKLRNLRQYMPGQERVVYELGAGLADRLNERLEPAGFVLSAELFFADLVKGESGFRDKPLPSSLAGYPKQMYALLRVTTMPQIIDAVCPPEFAAEIKSFQEEVNRDAARRYQDKPK